MRSPGVPNAWSGVFKDASLIGEERLAIAAIKVAHDDLEAPEDEAYSTAVYFFATPLFRRLAAGLQVVDVEGLRLRLCERINGRALIPLGELMTDEATEMSWCDGCYKTCDQVSVVKGRSYCHECIKNV